MIPTIKNWISGNGTKQTATKSIQEPCKYPCQETPELEQYLETLLYHSTEIGKLLRQFDQCKIEIDTDWYTYATEHNKHPIVIHIRRDSMDKMKEGSKTDQSTFNEINVRLHRKLGLTYDSNKYNCIYYKQ